jgi:hypothetical protein
MRRLAMVLAAMGATTGCAVQECNLMYAPDYVQIKLESASYASGAWRVEVDGLGCEVLLPGTPADVVCDDENGSLWVELTPDGEGLAMLSLSDYAPDSLDLVITLDGAEILSDHLTPEYATDEPNGEGCGERRSGLITVDVPAT